MYKELIDKSHIKNDLKQIDPKDLGLRKKIGIFYGEAVLLFIISQKSRILIKDTVKIEEIEEKVKEFTKSEFKQKIIVIDSPLCSKAKKELENLKWEVKV